jgi:hypothetical protein
MTRLVIILLVLTLFLPGLAMLFAVVLRYLVRGTGSATRRPGGQSDART